MPYNPANDQAFALRISNDALFGAVGEAQTITLQTRNTSTGAFSTLQTLAAGTWSKVKLSDGLGGFFEEFHIRESALNVANMKLIHAVAHGDRIYKINDKMMPQNLDRYWRLRIQPVEPA